ncbi:MAG: alkylhydroperoxidase-related (seleno)protein [Pseudomonadota bacterium]
MTAFAYAKLPFEIRADLQEAYRDAWDSLASPGAWWSGAARVAIAQEVRSAYDCVFCAERKAASSPIAPIDGGHNTSSALPAVVVDTIHRLCTDPSRLTQSWLQEATSGHDLSIEQYVEIISVVTTVMSIDTFHQVLGFDLEPLPNPGHGLPSRYIPNGLEHNKAWVPIIKYLDQPETDLWASRQVTNIMRALSLVPDAVRLLKRMSSTQYLSMGDSANPYAKADRALSRAQIELIAGRVSALNDCFYVTSSHSTMLCVIGEINAQPPNLQAVVAGSGTESKVPHGALLIALAEEALATPRDEDRLASLRASIIERLGSEALVDAAAVIGNFQRMVRIADGTGIPLDRSIALMGAAIREELALDKFGSADLTPKVNRLLGWLGDKARGPLYSKMSRRRVEPAPAGDAAA